MNWLGDVRSGFRALAKNPGFTAVAVAMLALGIGINATVFTVADAVLFKGFPTVAGNDRLLYISHGGCCISYPDFQDIRAQAKSFQGMGITHGMETAQVLDRGNTGTWFAFGRLRDGVSFAGATAETEGIIRRLETEYPVTDRREHLVAQNFAQFFIGANAAVIYGSMWGAVGFVLLIACANLANLMLARAAECLDGGSPNGACAPTLWR